MSYLPYPEPRYDGATGEPSGPYRPIGTPPELVTPSGTEVHYLATGASTDGQLGLYRYVMGPGRGRVHAFRNESGEPATMLILFTPGAPREDYFERVATAKDMSEPERAEFFLRHDTFWT